MPDLTYICHKCSMSLLNLKAANLVLEKPKVGDLIVCGGCKEVNCITVLGTRELTQDEISALHPDDQKDLGFAQRAIRKALRNN